MIGAILLLAGFLFISPGFRESLVQVGMQAATIVASASPYSYVGLGMALVGGLVKAYFSSKQPQ